MWLFTECFEDSKPETTLYETEEIAHQHLAVRALESDLFQNHVVLPLTARSAALEFLNFWRQEMSLVNLNEEIVTDMPAKSYEELRP